MPNAEGKSPAELMRGRPLRTIWSQLPDRTMEKSEKHQNYKYQVNGELLITNYGKVDTECFSNENW